MSNQNIIYQNIDANALNSAGCIDKRQLQELHDLTCLKRNTSNDVKLRPDIKRSNILIAYCRRCNKPLYMIDLFKNEVRPI